MRQPHHTQRSVGCWIIIIGMLLALWVAAHIDTNYSWPAAPAPEQEDYRAH